MTPLFKKLNFKDQEKILVLNAPSTFETELKGMVDTTQIARSVAAIEEIHFAIIFVQKQQQIDDCFELIFPKLKGDVVLWFSYPKGSSKKYSCDFNRDNGWETLIRQDFEGVRMVAIDEDWSALRFRKREYIKKITRQ